MRVPRAGAAIPPLLPKKLLKVDDSPPNPPDPKEASFPPDPNRPRGGGDDDDDDDEPYDVRLVEFEGDRVTVLLVSMEPGLERNTCSSGIRDSDIQNLLQTSRLREFRTSIYIRPSGPLAASRGVVVACRMQGVMSCQRVERDIDRPRRRSGTPEGPKSYGPRVVWTAVLLQRATGRNARR